MFQSLARVLRPVADSEQETRRHILWWILMRVFLYTILTGLALGVIEGMTKVFYPEASTTVVFVIMVLVLMFRPAGLFGKEK